MCDQAGGAIRIRRSRPRDGGPAAPIAIVVEPTHGQQQLPSEFAYFGAIFRDEMIAAHRDLATGW